MTNLISFPLQGENMLSEDMSLPVVYQHDLFPEYLEVVYMYENGHKEIIGLPIFQGKHYLLSIEDIQLKFKNQQFEKVTIEDEYGSTTEKTWNDFLETEVVILCKEGAFIFDNKAFLRIGELINTIGSTNVRIDKSFRVCFDGISIFLDALGEYQVKSQFKHRNEYGKRSNILIVKAKDEAPFIIPNDSIYMTIGYKDLALIGEPLRP